MLKSTNEKQVALVDNALVKSTKTKQKILEEEEYLKVWLDLSFEQQKNQPFSLFFNNISFFYFISNVLFLVGKMFQILYTTQY